ncbi:hypothetical protein ACQ859_17670 [Roseateles chitinivorans]|uniref:hypothetical protein n=1 Tax=Roseateles chitinivorans TaxID=2917965 RepID=UPI003D67E905
MSPEMLAFWLAGILPPTTSWILNLAMRGPTSLKTSGADWSLLLLVFDGAMAITWPDILCNVPNEGVRAFLPSLAPSLVFVSLSIWIVIVRWFEPMLETGANCHRPSVRSVAGAVFVWSLVVMNVFGHYFLFIRGFHVD